MAIPAVPTPHLILVESDLALGQCKALFDPPPLPRHPDQRPQRGPRRREDDVVSYLGWIAATAAHQHPMRPAPFLDTQLQPRQPTPGPIVAARSLGAIPSREALPLVSGDLGRDGVGAWLPPASIQHRP